MQGKSLESCHQIEWIIFLLDCLMLTPFRLPKYAPQNHALNRQTIHILGWPCFIVGNSGKELSHIQHHGEFNGCIEIG